MHWLHKTPEGVGRSWQVELVAVGAVWYSNNESTYLKSPYPGSVSFEGQDLRLSFFFFVTDTHHQLVISLAVTKIGAHHLSWFFHRQTETLAAAFQNWISPLAGLRCARAREIQGRSSENMEREWVGLVNANRAPDWKIQKVVGVPTDTPGKLATKWVGLLLWLVEVMFENA